MKISAIGVRYRDESQLENKMPNDGVKKEGGCSKFLACSLTVLLIDIPWGTKEVSRSFQFLSSCNITNVLYHLMYWYIIQ